jgi:hypothetical protein
MPSATEYREYADECFAWAKQAKTDSERDIFLQMARTWMEAALISKERDTSSLPASDLARPQQARDDNAAA